ncbi:MAG: transposase [Planctomycetota bacterium]
MDILLRKNKRAPATLSTFETARLEHLLAERVQSYLDGGSGACWFNRKEAATIMFESLQHFHEQRYRILAWCIMPNHVHVVLIPLHGFELAHIVRTWKSFSARRIGQILPVKKPFWQVEYYDHLIRDSEEYLHAIHYVLNNPEKAGLTEWPWVGEGLIAREL